MHLCFLSAGSHFYKQPVFVFACFSSGLLAFKGYCSVSIVCTEDKAVCQLEILYIPEEAKCLKNSYTNFYLTITV